MQIKDIQPGAAIWLPIGRASVHRKFSSKRNKVFLCSIRGEKRAEYLILKQYLVGDPEKEYQILEMLHKYGLNVPKPHFFNQEYLIMDYIPGRLLCDLIETTNQMCIEKIVGWFLAFHNEMKQKGLSYIKNDVNLRNFILFNNKFYGIDFEEVTVGEPAYDIGGLAAHILTNAPRFTEKKQRTVERIIETYCKSNDDVVPSDVMNYLWQWLRKIAARRPDEQQEILEFCFRNHKEWTC